MTEHTAPKGAIPVGEDTLLRIILACHSRLGRPLGRSDLDEVVQEVRVALFKKSASLPSGPALEGWIYGAARLCILQALRAKSRSRARDRASSTAEDVNLVAQPISSAPAAEGSTIRARVRRSLESLSPTIRTILRQRFEEESGFSTIARRLRLTRAAVRSKYYRALPRLRAHLQPLAARFGKVVS